MAIFPLPVLISDVAIVFFDPDFLKDAEISAIRVHLKQI